MAKKLGLQHAAKRRKELALRLAKEEQAWEGFKDKWPEEAQFLEEVRENSSDFQKQVTYNLANQMDDLYSFASDMSTEKRRQVLKGLNVVYPAKGRASPYLALMRAGSIPGYDKVRVSSKNAKKIESGIAKSIAPEDFGDWRKRKRS